MRILEYINPLDLSEGVTEHVTDQPLLAWMEARYQARINYVSAVVVDGRAIPREDWGAVYDEVRILLAPGDPWTIISVTMSVLSIGAAILNPPQKPNLPEDPSPTYTLGAQGNAARLGAGIPVHYGRVRVWPDLAAQPYTVYRDNDQYLFQLFCIGLGEFEVEGLKIDDSDVGDFPEIEYEYYYNEPVTLFPTNVETSVEPANQELTTTFIGPYVANATGTTANRIEVDVVFPSGLFRQRSSGNVESWTADLVIEYQEIDDAGTAVGSWTTLFNGQVQDAERAPLRITRGVDVPDGRYQIRMRRTDDSQAGPKIYNKANWEGMRAYLVDDAPVFEDVTVLAVKARATGNLNSDSQRRFNVVATRKLPAWDGADWTAPAATSAIAWALADMVRSEYHGDQPDANLDIEALAGLHTVWEARGDEFNFRFDTATTLWDALKLIAKAGRAYPILNAEKISFVRTSAQSAPVTIFNRHNIVRGSLKTEYSFPNEESHDAILAEYIDPAKGWVKHVVLCQPVGSAAEKPKTVLYAGITDRAQAFREGIFDATISRHQNKVLRFDTELEGYIPNRGDLIKVSFEDFDMDQGGEVVDVDGTTLTLSEPVEWDGELAHAIFLRKDNGDVSGPHLIEAGSSDREVVLNSSLSWTPYTGGAQERTKYVLGVVGSTSSNWIVSEIKPKGGNVVTLTCVNDVPSAHTADEADVPADIDPNPLLATLSGPIVHFLHAENDADPGILVAAWSPAGGARSYVVEKSFDDGATWFKAGETENNYLQFLVPPGPITIRVAAVGATRGPWKEWSGTVNQYVINSPTNLDLSSELRLNSDGDYETKVIFTFDPPEDDVHVQTFEAQYRFPRHGDWLPLFNALKSRHEFGTTELGNIHVRVRTVYLQDEVFSDWAETSITNMGTYDAISSLGLASPIDPKLFLTLDHQRDRATFRVSAGYEPASGAAAEAFVIFYSADDVPNVLQLGTDAGSRLNIDTSGVIEGEFDLTVTAGSTTTRVNYSDPRNIVDVDLSGIYWLAVISNAHGWTRFYKVTEADTTALYINPADPFPYVPEAGDILRVIEVGYHDSRLPEFKLAYIDGEVVQHNGVSFDGQRYYLDVIERGAEGTTQANQTNKELHYFPAFGADTRIIYIDLEEFAVTDGVLEYAGNANIAIPADFAWAAISCCFVRRGTKEEGVAWVRSHIIPLTVAGKA